MAQTIVAASLTIREPAAIRVPLVLATLVIAPLVLGAMVVAAPSPIRQTGAYRQFNEALAVPVLPLTLPFRYVELNAFLL